MHRLGQPRYVLDAAMPEVLAELYRSFDGVELFFGALTITPASEARRDGDAWRVGEVDGDDIWVRKDGGVDIAEKDTGERLREGARFERWVLGWVESQSMLFENDGEYRDDVFEETGEVKAEVRVRMLRRLLKRDPSACGPRWRLARALSRRGADAEAREQLEKVVADHPDFGWAWYDLGRISERMGDTANAVDELEAAAEANPAYEHAAFFYAHAARVAHVNGDQPRRDELGRKALAHTPELARSQQEAARHELAEGNVEHALELAGLAVALAPRDLTALDLLATIERERG